MPKNKDKRVQLINTLGDATEQFINNGNLNKFFENTEGEPALENADEETHSVQDKSTLSPATKAALDLIYELEDARKKYSQHSYDFNQFKSICNQKIEQYRPAIETNSSLGSAFAFFAAEIAAALNLTRLEKFMRSKITKSELTDTFNEYKTTVKKEISKHKEEKEEKKNLFVSGDGGYDDDDDTGLTRKNQQKN